MAQHSSIELLPEHLIDQIKAGEVIEKPSTLLKELCENAIDAGASQIDIHLIEAGLELIQVEDNGHGMSFDDLPKAFCRHATSKIKAFDDLYRLSSYGFRGEALASIAAVSKVTCSSQPSTPDRPGGKIQFHGGKQFAHLPYKSSKSGTSFVVQDLFYNTPVRLKFMRSLTSEKNALKKILHYFLATHPEVKFIIKWDDRPKKIYDSTTQEIRLAEITKSEKLLYGYNEYDQHQVKIFLSSESSKGHAHKLQSLYVNNRIFFDKSFQQLLSRKTEGLWPQGETGHWQVFIDTPPDQLDVNVHPNKTTVKFSKTSLIYSLISSVIDQLKEQNKKPLSSPSEQPLFEERTDLSHQSQSFSSSPYDEMAAKNFTPRQLGLEVSPDSHQQSLIIPLTGKYALIHLNDIPYLISIKGIISHYLTQFFTSQRPVPDHYITPLLISEPFKVKKVEIEKHLTELLSFGIELDFLDDQTLALRSIPQPIEILNRRLIIGELLSSLAKTSATDSRAAILTFFASQLPLERELGHRVKEFIAHELTHNFWTYKELNLITALDDHGLDSLCKAP